MRVFPGAAAALAFLLVIYGGAVAGEDPRISSGWERIAAGESTGCIDGGEYAFFVRHGSGTKLAIVLGGGGACWSGGTCDTCTGRDYRRNLITADRLGRLGGLLDFGDKRNPIRKYTVVFIPYCTADVHLGTHFVTYPTPPNDCRKTPELRIRHTGSANVNAALEWVFQRVREPKRVLVAGESGGAIPSPFYAARVARRFPRARIVQIGDAAGGYYASKADSPVFEVWGALDLLRRGWGTEVRPDSLPWTFEKIYVVAAIVAPKATFAQINRVDDQEQAKYMKLAGIQIPVSEVLAANLAQLHRATERFRSYTVPGTGHSVILSSEFYSLSQERTTLRDWVARLLDHKEVRDVGNGLLARRP